MRSLNTIKSLFENHLEELEREREELVKSRINSFFTRHQNVPIEENNNQKREVKVRSLYMDGEF